MKVVAVSELKAKLSQQLDAVKAGEEIVVTDRGRPIARILPEGGLEAGSRLQHLVRQGVLKLPVRGPERRPRRIMDSEQRLLQALLAERREED